MFIYTLYKRIQAEVVMYTFPNFCVALYFMFISTGS